MAKAGSRKAGRKRLDLKPRKPEGLVETHQVVGLTAQEQRAVFALVAKMREPAPLAPPKVAKIVRCCICSKGSPEPQTDEVWRCDSCVKRQATCAVCGDKTSEEVCGECIKNGYECCVWCGIRKPVPGNSKCLHCSTGIHAGDFKNEPFMVNTRDDTGYTYIQPQPGQTAQMNNVFMG